MLVSLLNVFRSVVAGISHYTDLGPSQLGWTQIFAFEIYSKCWTAKCYKILYSYEVSLKCIRNFTEILYLKLQKNFVFTLTARRKNDPMQCEYGAFQALNVLLRSPLYQLRAVSSKDSIAYMLNS
jgi:hypothetical protein